jgi:hypothetical protein
MAKSKRELTREAVRKAETLSEFVDVVGIIRGEWYDKFDPWGPWFRGQQRASWPLLPNLFREYGGYLRIKRNHIEDEIREEFAARAPVLSETRLTGSNPWDWYFQMQHFGAPTRLLDWTEGALIALYFAVRDNSGYHDAAVWVLDPYELNRQVIGREEVFPPSDAGLIQRDRQLVDPWLPPRFARGITIPRRPVAVYPTYVTRRISTQRSCFTVHGSDPEGIDRLRNDKERILVKIAIPSSRVRGMRKELEMHGIDELTVFPDLDGLGRAISARWKVDRHAPPHDNVYTRLRPSGVATGGVGVFAIRRIKKGTRLFLGDNEEMVWVEQETFSNQPTEIRKLYHDFAVLSGGQYGCPQNFNRLTMAWYLNEPKGGETANVGSLKETYDFVAVRDIRAGEELTVDYSTYSESPVGDAPA